MFKAMQVLLRGLPAASSRFRLPRGLGLAAAAFVFVSAWPASAQLAAVDLTGCYSIQSPQHESYIRIGERLDYDLSIVRQPQCPPILVESWSFSAITVALKITPNPFPGKEVGVEPLGGAVWDSAFLAQAVLKNRLTSEPVATIQRRLEMRVLDGAFKPDLVVRDVVFPPHVIEGRLFGVRAKLANIGDRLVDNDALTTLRVEDRILQSDLCPAPLLGDPCDQSFTARIHDPGLYTYTLCADEVDAIDEKNELNNCATGTFEVGAADVEDLLADSIVVSPQTPPVGQPTQVTAVARNAGGVASGPSTILMLTPDGAFTETCPGLEPLATCSRTFIWFPEEVGSNNFEMNILYSGPEDDFANNSLSHEVEVLAGSARPDFAVLIDDITIFPAAPESGEDVLVTYGMTNIGAPWTAPTVMPSLELFIDGTFTERQKIDETACPVHFETGDRCEGQFTLYAHRGGDYSLTVEVDSGQFIDEANEDNNSRTLHYIVGSGSGLSCRGLWTLTGTGATSFTTTASGSVVGNCFVYFGNNAPVDFGTCWQTVGDGGLEATWHRAPGDACPTSVTVSEPNPPHQTWNFDISIQE